IVVEAHDDNGQLAQLTQLLRDRGFHVIAEQDKYLRGSTLYNVYATRAEAVPTLADSDALYDVPILEDTILSAGDVRRHLQAKLPDYLVPAEIVVVEHLPRLPNGKVDRRALQTLDRQQPASSE